MFMFYGFVNRSQLNEGRTYKAANGDTKLIKECEIVLIAQEGERGMSMLNMVTSGKNWQVPVTDDGGIVFSTKHTSIDEDGSGKKSTLSCPLTSCIPER